MLAKKENDLASILIAHRFKHGSEARQDQLLGQVECSRQHIMEQYNVPPTNASSKFSICYLSPDEDGGDVVDIDSLPMQQIKPLAARL